MDDSPAGNGPRFSRRRALATTGGIGMTLVGAGGVHAETPSNDVLRVGLIGAGGRGAGAVMQTLAVPGSNAKLTAIADVSKAPIERVLRLFEPRGERTDEENKSLREKIDCPEDRRFEGFDGYRKLLEHCDLVILAAPPAFRPYHFEAAVKAGKHVFMEKPVCIDAFGARLCLEAAKQADANKLKVVVGLQRRYEDSYRQALARVRDGAIGEIESGQIYWNSQRPWWRARKPDTSELQYQVFTWAHFLWLSGDHIVEQHVHNIDIANWFLGRLPQTAYGLGGLQNRNAAQPTQIYDHHAVTFGYPGHVSVFSSCRQFPGGENRIEEEFRGTKGIVKTRAAFAQITDLDGKLVWKYEGKGRDPYQVEHDELHDAIRNDRPRNDAWYGATSSLTAVMGRYATYSGKQLTYDDVLAFDDRTMPADLSWDSVPPVKPEADGSYPVSQPAAFKLPTVKREPVS